MQDDKQPQATGPAWPARKRKTPRKQRAAVAVCLECGQRFASVTSAENAASNGCSGCGGVDIDVL